MELLLSRGSWFIIASLIVSYILTMTPMVEWLSYGRPLWVVLLIIYWVSSLPTRVGIWFAWFAGLYLDVLLDTPFGINALGLSFIAYATYLLHRRIRVFSHSQQVLTIMGLCLVYLIIVRLGLSFVGQSNDSVFWYWLPAFVSALIWPWFNIILENLSRRFYISETRV